jgi:uncharacterized repeat protein (TIGR03803 family)
LVRDSKGNLYGTTYAGGASGVGTVFKLDKAGKETVLYSFSGTGSDGANPSAGVIRDASGNLYGTTLYGGTSGEGTVFKLSKTGKETVLYNFCGESHCTDGEEPLAGLVEDTKGNLYGTTYGGGSSNWGTVFKVNKAGKETVLYSFQNSDAHYPYAGVIRDTKGNLYGTTASGGTGTGCGDSGCGTVFKVSKTGKETVLYSFTGATDGNDPRAGLIEDSKGNLYGTTLQGGTSGEGVVFRLSTMAEETVLHSFVGGTDGVNPRAGLIQDTKGNIYGTTYTGGSTGNGVVFELKKTGQETVLYTFCSLSNCTDGAHPLAGLILDSKGNLYGTNSNYGVYGYGAVFELTP